MKRKRMIIAGAAATVVAGILLLLSRPRAAEPVKTPAAPQPAFDVGIPTAQEVRNMLGVYGERVEANERELKALRGELEETRKQLRETTAALQNESKKDASIVDKVLQETSQNPKTDGSVSPRFKTFEFPKDAKGKRSVHLPAGSFGEATLLTGVYAPISGEPLPVLLRLDAALIGPSKSRIPIRHAYLVGKAQGDANSRRAVVQLDTLSLVTESGETLEAKVNGWVIDGDGIQGLSGTYVWRGDEIAGLAVTSGGTGAMADAFAAGEARDQITPLGGATRVVTGDHLKYAGFRGLGGAFGKLSEILAQRLNEIVPAIYVTNGQKVTVAFVSGATLEGLDVPEKRQKAYEGLDHE